MIYRNTEHYQDPTVGEALDNLELEGWEYNKIRYKMLQCESAEMIRKMKRSGTWPGEWDQRPEESRNAEADEDEDRPWRLV